MAIRVESPLNSNEFFLMEYRSKKGWDIALPNHGMLIWHIDYKSSIWSNSDINNDGSHQYVDIEEADGIPSIETTKGDAFPGSYKVTEFDQFILWNGTDMQISLSDIAESKDRTYVTFNVSMDAPDGTLELIEGIETDTPVSSSEAEIESSSSEDQPTIVSNGFRSRNINLYTTKDHSKLTIAGLPANARVYLFSVNGQLLYHNTFTGGTAEIDTRKFPVPLLVKIK